ncbi:MAG TPA: glycoside hydrolase family 5 protein [Polyangiaceae bacterium]
MATVAMAILAGCSGATTGAQSSKPAVVHESPTARVAHVQGEGLVGPDGRPLLLRGVAFGNRVWNNDRLPRTHHDERDYQRLRELGMNAVRFYLNYLTFESDAAPGVLLEDGFKWLDDNIKWAKREGIYLVLNFHVPPGGYQSLGAGKALWREPKQQARFVALWRAIAARYAKEPAIAGFDLLNEPVVDTSIDQWRDLAERTIAAIREVDPNHAIFVERVNAIGSDWSENANRNFFRVSDPNVVYEFHFYKPFHFTHQGATWIDFAAATGQYPDNRIAEAEWFLLEFATSTFDSPKLPAGDSDWHYYEGRAFTVKGKDLAIGKPSLSCASVGAGRAYFDDIVLERLDKTGSTAETLWQVDLDTPRGWYFWEKTPKGSRTLSNTGHGDDTSLSITGTTDDANLGADPLRFRPVSGATYRLSGWMKGDNIPATANCQIRLDFYTSKQPVQVRDRGFLAQELGAYLAWGKRERVPLFLGEFGAIKAAFDEDKGGIRWVADMLDLIHYANLSYTYHDYHEQAFGLYFGDAGLPDPNDANQPLLQLFKSKLSATPAPAQPEGTQR